MDEISKKIFNWYNLSKYRNIIYGFSAVWIVTLHIAGYFPDAIKNFHPFIIQLFQAGNVGVDIFLIMSGICLYFSLKKTNGKHIFQFYKRRFAKIFKIYFLVCIPWLIFWALYNGNDFQIFIEQATIFGNKGGHFWFIHFIAICYLIYPLLYKLIEQGKSYIIIIFIPIYFIFLCFLNANYKEFYASYEIALTRLIPFLIGTLLAKRVYEKKPISQTTILIFLALLVVRDAFFIVLQKKNFTLFEISLFRLYFTPLAISTIFLINIFFEIFKVPKIRRFFNFTGKISLEIYIAHLILIRVAIYILNIHIENTTQLLLFIIFFSLTSILSGKLIQYCLSFIPPKPPKRPISSPSSPPF